MPYRIYAQGLDYVINGLAVIPRSLKYAIPNYQNALAFGLGNYTKGRIREIFPTARPQTAKNVFVRKATASNGGAVVLFDQIYGKGLDEYMLPNIEGGKRTMKPSEQRLGRFYVPGAGAKLDRYGNMKGGQITQILSRLGRFGDVAGYDMNQTARSRARRSGASKATEYFILTQPRGGLKPGIYQRTESHNGFTSVGRARGARGRVGAFQAGTSGMVRGRGAVPVMVFAQRAPSYRPVWPFFSDAEQWINNNFQRIAQETILREIEKEMAYRLRHGR
jgi:hypothetical protein